MCEVDGLSAVRVPVLGHAVGDKKESRGLLAVAPARSNPAPRLLGPYFPREIGPISPRVKVIYHLILLCPLSPNIVDFSQRFKFQIRN